jgi:GrpB-like predicted nucleotidyltransferase (UPF0157 family)
MPPPIPVVLADYDPRWPQAAAKLAEPLRSLGPWIVDVHHIGSTAVPGLAAKPIIDLMPLVSDLAELDRRQALVAALGYDWHGAFGMPGRRYCTLSDSAGLRIAQLHFFEALSPHATRHIALRDYLRAQPDAAQAYETQKRRAQRRHPDDSHAYSEEKGAWVAEAEAKALAWFHAQPIPPIRAL